MQQPLVSILMPAFNADSTIAIAIKSCLSQTYANIEILVLNDGSIDYTATEINKFGKIRVINHDQNLGIANSRNRLLKEAKGEFIAWLDADDLMAKDRIEKQMDYLQKHPDIDIVGSWITTDSKVIAYKKLPTKSNLIKAHLWFKNCMVQPSILSKNFYVKEAIYYNSNFDYMEDYELWYRLKSTKNFANVPAFLNKYHMPSTRNIEQKLALYNFETKLNLLWDIKWKSVRANLSPTQKNDFQNFLYNFNKVNWKEAANIKLVLSAIKTKENSLMVHYYRLLLFTRISFFKKLRYFSLLFSVVYYPLMKYRYLV
jgi:glycosyltransferase involved in cell wall biosynthesis